MTMPTDLLDSARQIDAIPSAGAGNDALERAVVSRGYYAAYHAARDVQERLLLPPPAQPIIGSHERIFQSLLECTPGHSEDYISARSIGMIGLRTLKPYRKSADYDIGTPLPRNAKEETLARAAKILAQYARIQPK